MRGDIRAILVVLCAPLLMASDAFASDWEKFFELAPLAELALPYSGEPQVIRPSPEIIEEMWREGYVFQGMSSFTTGNSKTSDAVKLAKKLKSRYVAIAVDLDSEKDILLALNSPTYTTSYSSGNMNGHIGGTPITGTYAGTTTTYGSETRYSSFTISRYSKIALYFSDARKRGLGVLTEPLTPDDIRLVGTQRAIKVRMARVGSPADLADIIPGDIVTKLDGVPVDPAGLLEKFVPGKTVIVTLFRGGVARKLTVTTPAGWRQ